MKLLFISILSFTSLTAGLAQVKTNDTTYMLTYDHGGLILWGEEHFREKLQDAISWLDKYPSFKIGIDNEAQIYDYLAEHNVELLDEIKQYLRLYKGRFGIGSCTYGQPLSVFISDESNIRQIYYALDTEQKIFNYRPPVYMMSEHAMHCQIPQIIKGFGFDGAIMRTHFMMYGYNPEFDVPIGLWTGLDGSKIPTIPTYAGQGAEFGKTTVDTWVLTRYPSRESTASLDDFRKQFSHITPLLASRADDSDLRKEELVKQYEGNTKFQWILLDDLLRKYPAPAEQLVTKPNDFVVRMPWGYCGNEIWNDCRKAEVSVLTAERLNVLAMMYGNDSYEKELDKAWKNLLVSQHHDIQIVGLLPEARKLLPESYQLSSRVIDSCMRFFEGKMKGEGVKQITVFNPLSWKRSEWIMAYVSFFMGTTNNISVKYDQQDLPAYIIQANTYPDGSILDAYIAFNAPLEPVSLTTFSIVSAKEPAKENPELCSVDNENLLIKTPYYKLKLNTAGGIDYLKNANDEYLLQNKEGKAAFFEGTIDGIVCQSSGKWTIHHSSGQAPWVKMTENGFIADIPYSLDITLFEDRPVIECKANFDFNGQKIGLPTQNLRDAHSPFVHEEKLRFKMFPNIDNSAVGVRDLPFAIAETMDSYIEGNYWTAISGQKNSLAVFNKGIMASIREKDNSLSIPLAYSMYYIWGTRPLYGKYDYEFALYPFQGNWRTIDLPQKALEYSFQTPVFETRNATGQNSTIAPLQMQADEDIMMTAFYSQNGSIVARFFKYGETSNESTLTLHVNAYNFSEVDLNGNVLGSIAGNLRFNPWQFKTIKFYKKK